MDCVLAAYRTSVDRSTPVVCSIKEIAVLEAEVSIDNRLRMTQDIYQILSGQISASMESGPGDTGGRRQRGRTMWDY